MGYPRIYEMGMISHDIPCPHGHLILDMYEHIVRKWSQRQCAINFGLQTHHLAFISEMNTKIMLSRYKSAKTPKQLHLELKNYWNLQEND